MRAREADLMPVAYSHVVFTLPETLGPSALQTPTMDYDVLFQAVERDTLGSGRQPDTSGHGSALWPCCTPGGRTCCNTRVSTAWCRQADFTDGTDWVPGREDFSLRSGSSAASFAGERSG